MITISRYFTPSDLFTLFIFAGLSIFNGFTIAMFSQLNIFWYFYGLLFLVISIPFSAFILIYSIVVYIFRDIPSEKIYGYREILWNVFITTIFLILSITHRCYSPSQHIGQFSVQLILLTALPISIFLSFYIVVYLALSKAVLSKLDRVLIYIFIGTVYTMTWLYIVTTIFTILTITPSILRTLGIYVDIVFIAEEIAKYIIMDTSTPFILVSASACITIIELKSFKNQKT